MPCAHRGQIAAWMLARAAGLALGLAALPAAGCLHDRRAEGAPPRIDVAEEVLRVLPPHGGPCARPLLSEGRPPAGAITLVRYTLTAAPPIPLSSASERLLGHGRGRCASGVALLRAEMAEGAAGVEVLVAEAYVVVAGSEIKPGAPAPSK